MGAGRAKLFRMELCSTNGRCADKTTKPSVTNGADNDMVVMHNKSMALLSTQRTCTVLHFAKKIMHSTKCPLFHKLPFYQVFKSLIFGKFPLLGTKKVE
jgi:hypothetical protein